MATACWVAGGVASRAASRVAVVVEELVRLSDWPRCGWSGVALVGAPRRRRPLLRPSRNTAWWWVVLCVARVRRVGGVGRQQIAAVSAVHVGGGSHRVVFVVFETQGGSRGSRFTHSYRSAARGVTESGDTWHGRRRGSHGVGCNGWFTRFTVHALFRSGGSRGRQKSWLLAGLGVGWRWWIGRW